MNSTTSSMASATSTTAAQSSAAAASQAAKALRQYNNEMTPAYLAIVSVGIMLVFSAFHWSNVVLVRRLPQNDGPIKRFVIVCSGKARSVVIRKLSGFTSVGHFIVFVGFIAMNIGLSTFSIDWSNLTAISKRTGWVAIANLALITFLALKNTPLAFLTSYSYERLNILHQLAGYATVFWSLLHGVLYIICWYYSGSLKSLLLKANVMGIVAGFAMIFILFTSLFLRKMRYEIFYIVHIFMFMLSVIGIGMHRPKVESKTLYVTGFIAALWFLDRLIRSTRISYYFLHNSATITPLQHGGVRVTLSRSSRRAVPGAHAFLWIPTIRAAETHPFTILSTNPLEMVIKAHDGFTRDLLEYSQKNPGCLLKASMEGPYGALPSFVNYDQVVLIAGGSGASFTFGVALGLVRNMGEGCRMPVVNLIWVIRDQEMATWYSKELAEICCSPLVNLAIHVTGTNSNSTSVAALSPLSEKMQTGTGDIEKSGSLSSQFSAHDISSIATVTGRPDITSLIKAYTSGSETGNKTIVSACGPIELLDEVRATVAKVVGSGKEVGLHCESFGW